MDVISFGILLEYLYRKFITTFVICLIGAMVRESMNTIKLNMINVKKMISSVVVASAIMCAFVDNIKISFSIYAIACIVVGIWAQPILKLILNTKFMAKLVRRMTLSMKDPLVKGLTSSIDELDKDEQDDIFRDDSS